jgi:hypothetical protein
LENSGGFSGRKVLGDSEKGRLFWNFVEEEVSVGLIEKERNWIKVESCTINVDWRSLLYLT